MSNKIGQGSIRKRTDGRYEVRTTCGVDYKTGKAKRVSICAKTEEEAKKKLHELQHQLDNGIWQEASKVTLHEFYIYWLDTCKRRQIKQSTYTAYAGYLTKHLEQPFGNTKLTKLTTASLQDFFNYKVDNEISIKTALNIERALHECLRLAVEMDLIKKNPCDGIHMPTREKEEVVILTMAQEQALLDASQEFRLGCFVRFNLMTGLRIGELLGLRWEDVDFLTPCIRIRRTLGRLQKRETALGQEQRKGPATEIVVTAPKTKSSRRIIPLTESAKQELQEWKARQDREKYLAAEAWENPENYVVTQENGKYYEPKTFTHYYEKMLETAELPHFKYHALRHTFASRALEQGMDYKTLSSILGHTSVAFTMDTYAHVLEDFKQEQMAKMEGLFAKPKPTPAIEESNSEIVKYPVIFTPKPNGGWYGYAPDIEGCEVLCKELDSGLKQVQALLREYAKSETTLPPPSEMGKIEVPSGGLLMVV